MKQRNQNLIQNKLVQITNDSFEQFSLMKVIRNWNIKDWSATARMLKLLWAAFARFQMKSWQNLGKRNQNINIVTCISQWQNNKNGDQNTWLHLTKATDSAMDVLFYICCLRCGTMFLCYIKGCVILFRKQKPCKFPTNPAVAYQQPWKQTARLGFSASEVTGVFCYQSQQTFHSV